ncbi:family 10 glycosylhydrolase [Actinopolymorpha sp. B17G11]|uniref:family 10 glycosylhydrolase n=1 Tax=Actinopolymorpha sp. B17G11 TaxID=3160861 RepID=UPI0032E3935D
MGRIIRAISALGAVGAMGALLASSVGPTPTATAEPNPIAQWRSYWVDSFRPSIYTPENVDKLVADAEALGANALIVQVGRWMDCFCNRSAFPRTHVAIDPAFDPLDDVIEKAHAAGIEVHAWVNATPMWNAATPPPSPDHVFHTHGETATGADRWLNKRVDGAERVNTMNVMDPANPAAADYVVDGIASIVDEYDIDGINLDYIRYPDYNSTTETSDWGYSDVSLQRFRDATGRTDTPAPADLQWSEWRRAQVTALVRKIYLSMYERKPLARLSVNGITYGFGPQSVGGWERTRTYAEVMQDWKGWLDEGIIDTTVAMNYKREHLPDQQQMFREWNEVLADWQAGRHNVVGPAVYLNSVPDSVRQARAALMPTATGNRVVGWSGYSYAVPSAAANTDPSLADAERAALASAFTQQDPTGADEPVFARPAKVPSMPWKTRPETGHVTGELVGQDGMPLDQRTVSVHDLRTGKKVASGLTDGSGWFGIVDVPPGSWQVRADVPGSHDVRTVVHVRKGRVTTAAFAPS